MRYALLAALCALGCAHDRGFHPQPAAGVTLEIVRMTDADIPVLTVRLTNRSSTPFPYRQLANPLTNAQVRYGWRWHPVPDGPDCGTGMESRILAPGQSIEFERRVGTNIGRNHAARVRLMLVDADWMHVVYSNAFTLRPIRQ